MVAPAVLSLCPPRSGGCLPSQRVSRWPPHQRVSHGIRVTPGVCRSLWKCILWGGSGHPTVCLIEDMMQVYLSSVSRQEKNGQFCFSDFWLYLDFSYLKS